MRGNDHFITDQRERSADSGLRSAGDKLGRPGKGLECVGSCAQPNGAGTQASGEEPLHLRAHSQPA